MSLFREHPASDFAEIQIDVATPAFAPRQALKTWTIKVFGDIKVENNEPFFVTLTNPTQATIGDAQRT